MEELSNFKISCHAISHIMSGEIGLTDVQQAKLQELTLRKNSAALGTMKPLTPNMVAELEKLEYKLAHPELPVGAKTYIKKWLKHKLYHRDKDWKLVKIEKGLQCEPQGIELIGKVFGIEGIKKNEVRKETDYIQGCCDIELEDMVKDNKCSWDLDTFPMFDTTLPDDGYEWQLQGYMIIYGKQKASVDYTLIDTPIALMMQDLRSLHNKSGGHPDEWTPEKYEELYVNYQFGDIPEHRRVKSFEVIFDPTVEEKINKRVIMCRQYINELIAEN